MTSRERALTSLRHAQPDRVPVDYWSTQQTDAKLCAALGLVDRGVILDHFGADFFYIDGPAYIGEELTTHEDGSREDLWGVPRVTATAGAGEQAQRYSHVVQPPLAEATSVADVENYPKWPDPDWFDYSLIKQQCADVGERCVMFMGDRLNRIAQFKPAQYLRGMERVMIDLIESPEVFQAIVERIGRFYGEYLRRILAAADGGIDVVVTGDTLGLHAALALGKRVVALFGPTSPWEIDMYGQGERITAEMDCICCYRTDCVKSPGCMDRIGVERVLDATRRALERATPAAVSDSEATLIPAGAPSETPRTHTPGTHLE